MLLGVCAFYFVNAPSANKKCRTAVRFLSISTYTATVKYDKTPYTKLVYTYQNVTDDTEWKTRRIQLERALKILATRY